MRFFLIMIMFLVDLLGFGGASIYIGLWWTKDFIQGTHISTDGSLFRATVGLMVASVMYYKLIFQPRTFRTPSRFYFYTTLAVSAVAGYLYGVVFRWV